MKSILLTFDVEEFDLPKEYNNEISEKQTYDFSKQGLLSLTELLTKHNLKSTFFTTANFAQKYPKLIKDFSKEHEIASHSFCHGNPCSASEIQNSKKELEKITKKKIKGFRAPKWNIKNLDSVDKAGFSYDSSTHPIFLPGKYNNLNQKRKIHKIGNLTEIPMSTIFPNLSLFWLAFRNFPFQYAKTFTKLNFLSSEYTMLLFHPWEFQNLEHFKIPNYIKRNSGNKLNKMLEKYILFAKKNKYEFNTIHNFLSHKFL